MDGINHGLIHGTERIYRVKAEKRARTKTKKDVNVSTFIDTRLRLVRKKPRSLIGYVSVAALDFSGSWFMIQSSTI